MADYGGRFESAKALADRREVKRRVREEALAKAQAKYENEERKKQLKRLRGEDTWMLPDVNERIGEFSEEHSIKSKKKKKKSKKDKKVKKRNKSKDKTEAFSDSSSSSELEWVESTAVPNIDNSQKPWKIKEEQSSSAEKTDPIQRDEWMTLDFMSIKSVSTAEIQAGKLEKKKMEHEKVKAIEQAEVDKRELNPFWKNGGTGLPSEENDSTEIQKAASVEDGGLSWLTRSYKRMKEQAERDQRQLEDVIAERYGSVEVFQEKLQAAEEVAASSCPKYSERSWRGSWGKTRNWTSDQIDKKKHDSGRGQNVDKDRHEKRESAVEREKLVGNFQDEFKWKRDKERQETPSRCKDNKSIERGVEMEHAEDKNRECRIQEEKHKEKGQRSTGARNLGSDHFHEREKDKSFPLNDLKSKFLKPEDSRSGRGNWGIKFPSCSNRLSDSQPSQSCSFQKPDDGSDRKLVWSRSNSGKSTSEQLTSLPHQRSIATLEEMPNAAEEWTETKPRENTMQAEGAQCQRKSSSRATAVIEESVLALSEEEMNKLGAKVIKAELMGNIELASKLKAQLEEARKLKERGKGLTPATTLRRTDTVPSDEDRNVVLVRTDPSGRVWPVDSPAEIMIQAQGKKKRQMIETHHEGERIRYFQDDDNLSLQDLVRQEKMATAEDQNERFSRMASKFLEKMDRDYYTLDDMFVSKAARKDQPGRECERQRNKAMHEHKHLAKRMEKCQYCFDNPELPKHLIISIGVKVYLCLPNYQSMTDGHCLIVPLQHHTAGNLLDEDIWEEVQLFRKTLVKMLEDKGLDCVFFETNMSLKKRFHMVYECIPLPKELGDMAPIYFKKAIMESDEEWAMNKKLVDLSIRDIRRAVPKGLPYFSVDFGLQGGFAHVIENEDKFPFYFGKEIVGGMLDLEPRRWRKPYRENFDDQRKKVLQFSQWWKPYDCTKTKNKE
ncbi:CWF19-like protein 2 isoform X1 [Hypanus sabinus]|uniref:CWF19-like protein 2 isoform X1 n=1 Tax=Hypanus sabinus TaxID=79690 RepID=UPI0028C4D2C8|nr:CWF19-like protein 2 isoform X1 [Hypanus sabinus]